MRLFFPLVNVISIKRREVAELKLRTRFPPASILRASSQEVGIASASECHWKRKLLDG